MTKTRMQMIIETLKDNPTKRFTARELVKAAASSAIATTENLRQLVTTG